MTPIQIGILGCVLLLVLLASSMPVAFAMAVVGFFGFAIIVSPSAAMSIITIDLYETLSSYSLTVIPLFALASRYFGRRIRSVSRVQRRYEGAISALVEEGIANIPLVRAYGLESQQRERFARTAQQNARSLVAISRLKVAFSPIIEFVELGGVLVVVAAGAWALAQGQISLGGLLVFLTYLTQLLGPVNGLSQLVGGVAGATAGAERVLELLDEPEPTETEVGGEPLSHDEYTLTLAEVSFTYPGADVPALQDVSFTVSPGQTVALVGESGAGKSTVARLLMKFHEPDSGVVLFNGQDAAVIGPGRFLLRKGVQSLAWGQVLVQECVLGMLLECLEF